MHIGNSEVQKSHQVISQQLMSAAQTMMFHDDLQGDLGPPGPAGLTGLPGAGIQGEKVGDFFPQWQIKICSTFCVAIFTNWHI